MERLTANEIALLCGGSVEGDGSVSFTGISTDSRTVKKGDFFIALKGNNFDGDYFARQAVEKGAAGVMGKGADLSAKTVPVIRVDDTGRALVRLAKGYLAKFPALKIAGVTGSNGKTTVKDMAGHILSAKMKTLKPEGSFNNAIGMPLTILKLDSSFEALVLEYGTNHKGEISGLCEIAVPDAAAVTNIGTAHLEHFMTADAILEEKLDLLRALKKGGTAVINADDQYLKVAAEGFGNKLMFGVNSGADVRAGNISELGLEGFSFTLFAGEKKAGVKLASLGRHNIHNALAAAGLGLSLGLDLETVASGLSTYRTESKHRLASLVANGVKIIDDTYNANPESIRGALSVLSGSGSGRKIAVLADMGELGESGIALHFETGRAAGQAGLELLVTVGSLSRHIALGAVEAGLKSTKAFHFEEKTEAGKFLKSFLKAGDTVLVKGSRKMKMEELVDIISGRA